jgi:hypothetical protein
VPTTRKRHTITETDDVEQALAPLRAEGARLDFAELVIRGAQSKLADLQVEREDDARRRALREQFLERTRTGQGIDFEALLGVHERGWIHSVDG